MKRPVTRIAVVILCLMAAPSAIAQDTVRRTPWGDPDLEGIWTNATLTPLQRPPELAGKEFFTAEEAAQFRRTRIEQTNADRPLPARPGRRLQRRLLRAWDEPRPQSANLARCRSA